MTILSPMSIVSHRLCKRTSIALLHWSLFLVLSASFLCFFFRGCLYKRISLAVSPRSLFFVSSVDFSLDVSARGVSKMSSTNFIQGSKAKVKICFMNRRIENQIALRAPSSTPHASLHVPHMCSTCTHCGPNICPTSASHAPTMCLWPISHTAYEHSAVRSERTSERCERTSERMSEWPSTYVNAPNMMPMELKLAKPQRA